VSELALAAFAAHTDSHLIAVPRGERFARFEREFDERAFVADLERRGLRWLPRSSSRFPRSLGAIFDAPAGLFLRGGGEPEMLDRPAVAIVGARSCSSYGADVARMLGRELAAAGLVVVSGLARGVDGHAHRGALDAGGLTVAVLGCGIDRDYPAAHAELAADRGARPRRVRVRTRGRAGAVALSGLSPDSCTSYYWRKDGEGNAGRCLHPCQPCWGQTGRHVHQP